MDIAPVLDLEDVVAGKVCALASRIEPRDYADVVAALQRHGPSQLIRLSRPAGSGPGRPGLRRCPAAAGPDDKYDIRRVGLSQADVTAPRARFAGWPRDAEAIDRHLQAGNAAEPQPGRHRDAVVYVQAPVSSAAAGCQRRPAGRSPA
jgi:hypothetical protein